jgi:hypothetical protein
MDSAELAKRVAARLGFTDQLLIDEIEANILVGKWRFRLPDDEPPPRTPAVIVRLKSVAR